MDKLENYKDLPISTSTPPTSDFWRGDPKGAVDRVLGKFSSRKLLVWVVATIAMFMGYLDASGWMWISVAYIGSQMFVDMFTQSAMVKVVKSGVTKTFDSFRPTYATVTPIQSTIPIPTATTTTISTTTTRNPPIVSDL